MQVLLASAIGEVPEPRPGGTRWYEESATVGPHILVAWSPRTHPDKSETYVEVRQSALDLVGGAAALDLAEALMATGVKFTRVDAYLDDRAQRATPGVVAEAFRRGQVLTHVRTMRSIEQYAAAAGTGATLDGATTYLGSAASPVMVRVYDKAAESGRPDAGVRWELQARGERAGRLMRGALEAREHLGRYVLGCVRGLVDFRDRTGSERGDRASLLSWWVELIADAERVTLAGPARIDTLETRAVWIRRQVAPSLALATQAYGMAWLREVLRDGDDRLTEADRGRLLRPRSRAKV